MAEVITFGESMLCLQPCYYERFVQTDRASFAFGGGARWGRFPLSNILWKEIFTLFL